MARDDFPRSVIDALAKRVGVRCSNPICGKLTMGPRAKTSEVVNIGVGAHITAASPGGPRFNPDLTTPQRQSIDNGLWLCQNCAKLVDNDPTLYTEDVLHRWKQAAEDAARAQLESDITHQPREGTIELRANRRELIKSWRVAIEGEKFDFIDYRSTFLSSALYSSMRLHLSPEVVKKIEAPRTFYVGGARGDFVRKYMLLDEVARIENLWGLV